MFSTQDDNPFLCCHPEQDSFKSVSAKDLVRGSLSSSAISRLSSPNVFAGDPVDRLDSRLKLAGMTNHSDLTNDVLDPSRALLGPRSVQDDNDGDIKLKVPN